MKNAIIGVLSVLIILTGGYLVYDKVLMNESIDNKVEIDNIEKEENSTVINEKEALNIVKDLTKKYFHSLILYHILNIHQLILLVLIILL